MTISIPPEFDRLIEEQINAGRHPDPAHVVMFALAAMESAADLELVDTEELRQFIQEGVDDLRAGRSAVWDTEEVKVEGYRLLAESRGKAK